MHLSGAPANCRMDRAKAYRQLTFAPRELSRHALARDSRSAYFREGANGQEAIGR